jgi:heme A synthase
MAGMKASLNYPTWPDMHGEWIPGIVLDGSHWRADHFLMYDQSGFMSALVQVVHRHLGYLLFGMVVVFVVRWIKEQPGQFAWMAWSLLGIIIAQITLGILTLVFSIGSIPVLYGALHQGVGILFMAFLFYIRLTISIKRID